MGACALAWRRDWTRDVFRTNFTSMRDGAEQKEYYCRVQVFTLRTETKTRDPFGFLETTRIHLQTVQTFLPAHAHTSTSSAFNSRGKNVHTHPFIPTLPSLPHTTPTPNSPTLFPAPECLRSRGSKTIFGRKQSESGRDGNRLSIGNRKHSAGLCVVIEGLPMTRLDSSGIIEKKKTKKTRKQTTVVHTFPHPRHDTTCIVT